MPVQNGMGSPALDFHVCIPIVVTPAMVGKTVGLYVGVETKAEGKSATARQTRTIEEIRAAGGATFVIDDQPTEIATWLMAIMTKPAK